MADDPNTTQEVPSPDSSLAMVSEPVETSPKTPETSQGDFSAESNNSAINKGDAEISQPENGLKTTENQDSSSGKAKSEPVSESVQATELQTAQMAGNEPFEDTQDKPSSPEPVSVSNSGAVAGEAKAELEKIIPVAVVVSNKNKILELLAKAKNAIQFRKRKKLDRVMSLFDKKKNGSASSPQVTNDEVEKFLHVSDATAERYLNILEKENKIKQVGKTGKAVSYSRI